MLPNGWKKEKLGNLTVKVGSGVTPRGGSESYKDAGIALIRSQNVGWGNLKLCDVAYIDEQQHQVMSSTELKYGDVLLNITGASIGRAAIYELQKTANVNQHVCIVRLDTTVVPKYILYWLLSKYGQNQVDKFQAGGNRQGLNFEQVRSFSINLPPLAEQEKIAAILSTWDDAIATVERLIANSEAQKKALMQQLLTGKTRLKKTINKLQKFKMTDVAEVDKETLGTNTKEDYTFRYISLSDVVPGNIARNLSTYRFSDAPSRARRKLKTGDLLISTVRPNLQGFAQVTEAHADCIASTGFSTLTARSGFYADYIYHYFFSGHMTSQLHNLVVGSSYPAINSSDVSNLFIYCPSYSEQVEIATVLNNSDETIQKLTNVLERLKNEKEALMQQLLTGKRRVNVKTAQTTEKEATHA